MTSFEHIFLITVDCLRADSVGCIGGDGLTPSIDKLSEDSVLYKKAFANGPGTNQSFPSILTSTYFLMHGGMRLLPYFKTLAEILHQYNFKTVAFHSNPFLSASLGWNRGFDEFYDFMNTASPSAFVTRLQEGGLFSKTVRLASTFFGANRNPRAQRLLKKIYYKFHNLEIPYLEGKELNKHVIGWIEKGKDRKFFVWMHYMDPHYPYLPPDGFLSTFSTRKEAFEYNLSVNMNNPSKEEVKTLRSLYEDEVRYTDACIGDFLEYLRDNCLLDGSLILLTGDHGHAFMEHGRFAHAYDILYNEVIHVPLIIFGMTERQKVDTKVQLLDIPPTILDLLGIEEAPSFMGRSLLDANEDSTPIFSESAKPDLINVRYDTDKTAISCITEKAKLIINKIRGTIELYDLEKDFQEKNNRFGCEKELYAKLTSLIKNHLSNEDLCRLKVKSRKTEDKIKRLRSLGYI